MKIGILCESPADEAAIRILAAAIVRQPVEILKSNRFRAGGWSAAIKLATIETEIKHLHFQTDAEGLIIVVDSDDSPVHETTHDDAPVPECRACQIAATVTRLRPSLQKPPQRRPVKVAVGFPVPAIEAWFRCGRDPHAAEDRFVRAFRAGEKLTSVRKQLKREVYGTDRPSLRIETEFAVQEATRLSGDIERLRTQFPRGFGSFYETLASWR
jgi:hypothetical protein